MLSLILQESAFGHFLPSVTGYIVSLFLTPKSISLNHNMSDSPIFGFNCSHPGCGKLFKMRYPGKPGYYKVTCPHCGEKVTVKVPAPKDSADAKDKDVIDKPADSAQAQEKQEVDNSGKILDFTDYPDGDPYFYVGERAIFTCPHCHKRKLAYTAHKEGKLIFTCPGCKGKVRVAFFIQTHIIIPLSKFNENQGKLVRVRSFLRNVNYSLPVGEHIIGRADKEQPSTISIKGDNSMSPRSVSITATFKLKEGFCYHLKVLNATNPVLHCDRALSEGEEIKLNFGDEIRVGHTLFRFEVDEKAPKFPI